MSKSFLAMGLALALAAPSSAAVIFSDGFAADAAGNSFLNFTGFSNWTVTSGAVDLVATPNGFGITCAAACVDLGGSPGPGAITSKPIALSAGLTYNVSFQLGGNQRIASTDPFTFEGLFAPGITYNFLLGTGFTYGGSGMFTSSTTGVYGEAVAGNRPFVTYSFRLTPQAATALQLRFATPGPLANANVGPLLQNVSVVALPEPSSWAMLITGFGLIGAGMRRRRAVPA